MSLKSKFKTKEEIPAEHLSYYAERDGGWILDVDGAVKSCPKEGVSMRRRG